jgi:breast cancer 2 susceptibility protein
MAMIDSRFLSNHRAPRCLQDTMLNFGEFSHRKTTSHAHKRLARSPSSSPVRKKQRLSSPTYDEQLGDLSQECLDAFDKFDELLSQAQPVSKETSSGNTGLSGPSTDADSPFFVSAAYTQPTAPDLGKRVAQPPSQTGSTSMALSDSDLNKSIPLDTHLLFKSAKVLKRSHSPVANDDDSYTPPPDAFPSFRSAKSVGNTSHSNVLPDDPEDKENSGFFIPSVTALAAAKARLQLWEKEWESSEMPEEANNGRELENDISLVVPLKVASPRRPALAILPPTSTPRSSSLSTGFQSAGPSKSRAFRPPTFKTPANLPKPSIGPSSSQPATIPPRTPAYNTPTRPRPPILSTQTPKPLGSTPRSLGMTRSSASRFVPPFKSKLGPSQAPNQQGFQTPSLQSKLQNRIYPPAGARPSPLSSVKQSQKTAMLPPARPEPIAPLKLIPGKL